MMVAPPPPPKAKPAKAKGSAKAPPPPPKCGPKAEGSPKPSPLAFSPVRACRAQVGESTPSKTDAGEQQEDADSLPIESPSRKRPSEPPMPPPKLPKSRAESLLEAEAAGIV